jgi:hypothetical protein
MHIHPVLPATHCQPTRRAWLWLFAALFCGLAVHAQVASPDTVLARVDWQGSPANCPLPVHAHLQDATGRDYLLVLATRPALTNGAWPHQVLDTPVSSPGDYLLALPMRAGAREAGLSRFHCLHDDGRQLLLRATPAEAEVLAELGFALQRLSPEPIRWAASQPPRGKDGEPWSPRFSSPPDARVGALVAQVSSTNLYWLLRRLAGDEAVLAGGGPFVLSNRNTAGGQPLSKALQFAQERFQALGLNTEFHPWTMSGYSNRNLVATQPGGALSNELVLVVAHLDNMPTAARAPGADDNASGCVAVLTAASLFRQLHCERTIRYVLFTGEEQGLFGSTRYAAFAASNHDNIVGVVNLDMIAWNGPPPPNLNLYTRATSNPGYTNDLAIASLFTNCVTTYGLSNDLAPRIIANSMGYSDHAPFWNQGFPAALVIEQYDGDFNPYYHTANDNIARVNWRYFTAAIRGALATAAHMARPTGTRQFGMLEVADSDWRSGSSLGAGAFRAFWGDGVSVGLDAADVPWSNAPAPTQAAWLQAGSVRDGIALQTEARPDDGDVRFSIQLTAVVTNETSFATTNRLRFELLAGAQPDRLYTARVELDPAFAGTNSSFLCFTNLRQALNAGGFVALPELFSLTNGARYGNCEVAIRTLATNRADIPVRLALSDTGQALVTRAQVGSRIADEVQTADWLGGGWQSLATLTNQVVPDADSFDSGWRELTYPVSGSDPLYGAARYYRIQRTWLPQ